MASSSIYGKQFSPRKAMGMGMGGYGDFGVDSIPGSNGTPITSKDGGSELADHQRGIGSPVKRPAGMHDGHAAPDHGSTMDGWSRGGKV